MSRTVASGDGPSGRRPHAIGNSAGRGHDRAHGRTAIVGLLVLGLLGGCADTGAGSVPTRGSCPVKPVEVVVSIVQWGDIVGRLGGDCALVRTIVSTSTSDPHEFEPTPRDLATFAGARLVVLNGLGYDDWARRAIDALGSRPTVVDAGGVARRRTGDNPHIWYSPEVVRELAAAVTASLRRLAPAAAPTFDAAHRAWLRTLAPYDALIARIRSTSGKTYAATESVFDEMAASVGLRDVTPEGYRRAVRNESEPSPGDVAALMEVLTDHVADVLVVNTQTEGALTGSIRRTAETARVPVVEVTETLPDPRTSFVDWQVAQLRSLASALGA